MTVKRKILLTVKSERLKSEVSGPKRKIYRDPNQPKGYA